MKLKRNPAKELGRMNYQVNIAYNVMYMICLYIMEQVRSFQLDLLTVATLAVTVSDSELRHFQASQRVTRLLALLLHVDVVMCCMWEVTDHQLSSLWVTQWVKFKVLVLLNAQSQLVILLRINYVKKCSFKA